MKNISWQAYWLFVSIICLVYYSVIIYKYYLKTVVHFFQKLPERFKNFSQHRTPESSISETKTTGSETSENNDDFPNSSGRLVSFIISFTSLLMTAVSAFSQDGNAGINQATTMVKSYFDSGSNLVYAIGALVGLVGAVKVYNHWNHGEHDTGKVAAAWFGSCVFLVVVATVIKSFFGL